MKKFFRKSVDSGLSGAYVLHALDQEESTAFERLLGRSESLRAEVTELGDTAALLGAAVPAESPSEALRTRVLAQIENTPQLPETATKEKASRGFVRPRLRIAMAGLLVTAALVAGVVATQTLQTTPQPQASLVAQAGDARSVDHSTASGTILTVGWSFENAKAYASVRGGYPLPTARVSELWVTDSAGTTRPAGFLTGGNEEPVVLTGSIKHGDTVRMTVEPQAGSKYPTTTPIATVKL